MKEREIGYFRSRRLVFCLLFDEVVINCTHVSSLCTCDRLNGHSNMKSHQVEQPDGYQSCEKLRRRDWDSQRPLLMGSD